MSFSTDIEFLDKYQSVENFSTTLRAPLTSSGEEVALVNIDNLPEAGWVTIAGEEVIFYAALITGEYPGLSGCERPVWATSWPTGTCVEQRYNAEVINNLIRTLR